MGVRVDKLSTKYGLSVDDYNIEAEVFADGDLVITTHRDQKRFLFEHSDPETVEAIAKLLAEAAKLGAQAAAEEAEDE